MSETTKHDGIVSALSALQADLPVVAKESTATVPTKAGGKYTYTYATLADVAKTVYPLLAAHGLAFTCQPEYDEAVYLLRGSLEHASGEARSGVFPLPASADPQQLGSAITYGRRYLLGCLTGVVTDDDDDGNAAKGTRPARKGQSATDPLSALRAQIKQAGEAKGLTVGEIGDDFTAWSQGELITDADSATLTRYLATLTGEAA